MRPGRIIHDQRQFEPISNIQFTKNLRQVRFHCALGNGQALSNLFVALAIPNKRGNFVFALSKIHKQVAGSLLYLIFLPYD